MVDELDKAIKDYQTKWQKLITELGQNPSFFKQQRPTAIAWQAKDIADLMNRFETLRSQCDQIHFGWVNERWLVTMHLKDTELAGGIEIIKLMQRRPNSSDPIGLDHLDFYNPKNDEAEAVLKAEPALKWTHETNNPHCSWYSVWFAGTEAKLRIDTVLGPCIAELQDALLQA